MQKRKERKRKRKPFGNKLEGREYRKERSGPTQF
jgi:hypothetical protein